MQSSACLSRTVSVFSGIIGLGVVIASSVLLAQSVNYRSELGYLFGNRYTYNVFGYQLDPIIGIAAGGLVIGILQFLSCFILCGVQRRLAIGWSILHVILLIGCITCFAFAFYEYVYFNRYFPLNGLGGMGLSPGGFDPYNNNFGIYNNIYPGGGFNNYNNYGGGGFGGGLGLGVYDSSGQGYYNTRFNPAGQAYCGMLGIDMIFLLVAVGVVGCAGRNYDRGDDYEVKVQHK